MGKTTASILAFNRGLVSPLGLARSDIQRIALSAEVCDNWIPRVLGSMTIRPGTQFIGNIPATGAPTLVPFVFSNSDTALLELTDFNLRVWLNEQVITRPAVTAAVANGDFLTDLTGWTSGDEPGASSTWGSNSTLILNGNGTSRAIRTQTVTVSNPGVEHALRIVILRGPVTLRVGSTVGGDEYITETTLEAGTHSLAFTPTGNFTIWFGSPQKYPSYVFSCKVETPGPVSIPTPWSTANLPKLRMVQSADVIFVACAGVPQQRIERRGKRSWSVAAYVVNDGPFRAQNLTPTTLTASALTGTATITASAAIFKPTHVGSKWRLSSKGQSVTGTITGANQWTNAIKVVGVGDRRKFTIARSGTWSATVKLQRSFTSATGPWEDSGTTYTSNGSVVFSDSLDNSTVWYRLGVDTGDFTSGTLVASLTYTAGTLDGIVRMVGYNSPTSMSAEIIQDLGSTTATDNWYEGVWSDFRGYPSSVVIHDGRLWWAGKDKLWGSVSDAYNSFDDTQEGDAGTIARSLGTGAVDNINWMASTQRMFIGGDTSERTVQASAYDEVLTPTNFGMRESSTLGSANIAPIRVDQTLFFIHRGLARLYSLTFDFSAMSGVTQNITTLVPEVGAPGFMRASVQRLPDTRLLFARGDGTMALMVYDNNENVTCWLTFSFPQARVVDVCVLPGLDEDLVYLVMQRTVQGNTVYYLERMSREDECYGGPLCKLLDANVSYTGTATNTINGLDHLNGMQVAVWANGNSLGTFTVNAGAIVLPVAVSNAVVGIPYTATYKSTKLNKIGAPARIATLALLLRNVHAKGLRFGQDFSSLESLPDMEEEALVNPNSVTDFYNYNPVEFGGGWDTDTRVCLQASAPLPCTVLGVLAVLEENLRG